MPFCQSQMGLNLDIHVTFTQKCEFLIGIKLTCHVFLLMLYIIHECSNNVLGPLFFRSILHCSSLVNVPFLGLWICHLTKAPAERQEKGKKKKVQILSCVSTSKSIFVIIKKNRFKLKSKAKYSPPICHQSIQQLALINDLIGFSDNYGLLQNTNA